MQLTEIICYAYIHIKVNSNKAKTNNKQTNEGEKSYPVEIERK